MPDIEHALEALAQGRIIIITGDRLRGGDIDFAVAARHVTADAINFMASHGRGLICLTMRPERAVRLGIGLLNPGAERQSGRPFGRSIEARHGVETGISAADRAHTVRVATAPEATGDDLVSPGHVFPLIGAPGGVRERAAAAEASIELCNLAGAGDMAVICSIMRDDGEMARIDDLDDFIARHAIPVADIGALIDRIG
ncbi:3,4-dihydroxy-2-butanone-4-phosphate synthase [Sphingopyxis sp. XHP0097]|jgi:3,4-dihydroxy 2-butanone 4-phosphate synthase/GTP cyclohydrolase II|uniref:3,4-dihydroxy-2-butanone 4-phosphate synthase n=1 Tax=Sphingopyxis jiangsuensis TaxID=2871171 RepID=A0ABS7MAG6_9SPHN|nr:MULTISPECIES: 3,4-dihydroxy-2-butanone-4-phosphate synthase [Sphingopyxis]MBL0768260.1 3,4-dihydroxy-2-butanone-4-phosphate synthase [Sphingopyxis lutea]MBY4636025.1 3,4-dihydroxy-2-butanone-4-phosphate synthase [Sphingopyxis jiangsuensis]